MVAIIMWLIVLVIFSVVSYTSAQFEVPDALVEVFQPRGLRVSIPDQDGIKLFAFHGKINEEMNGREGGTFSRDILKAKDGRWTFYDPTAQLKVGDTLYYWTYADYFDGVNKLGYPKDDQKFVVTELLDKEGASPVTPASTKPPEQVTLKGGCRSSVTTQNKRPVCTGHQIFNEMFSSLKSNVWTPEIRFAGGPDYEFVLYGNRSENLEVQNGHLKIQAIPTDELYGQGFVSSEQLDLGDACTGIAGTSDCSQEPNAFLILPPVTSALITTKDKFSFKYGKIELRAKLPKGDWLYPELYLNPRFEEYGPGYASGQIRIAIAPGNADLGQVLHGGAILGRSTAARNYALKDIKKNDGTWSHNFHKFQVLWEPNQITVSVDDRVYGSIRAPKGGFGNVDYLATDKVDSWRTGTEFAPFDKEMYVAIGVGAGGQCFEDRKDGTKPWAKNDAKAQKNFYKAVQKWRPTWKDSSALQVDYIKIWAL